MAHAVFICHTAPDQVTADAVVAHLEREGIACWDAPRDIAPGASWAKALVEAIDESQAVVAILSREATTSAQLVREVERATSNGIPTIWLRIEDVEPSPALGYFMGTSAFIDATDPPLDPHLGSLVRLLDAILGEAHPAGEPGSPRESPVRVDRIAVDVVESDALDFPTDVLALKNASGAFYGVDKAVAARYLDRLGLPFPLPAEVGEGRVVESRRCIAARRIAVIGVPGLFDFGHREIRRFASAILEVLHADPQPTAHLALTIQGTALLLDEGEVLETQLGGLIDALDAGHVPDGLERITFVERDPARAEKLRLAVERVVPDGWIPIRAEAEAAAAEPSRGLSPATAPSDDVPAGTLAPFEPYRGTEPYLFVSYAHADGDRVFRHLGRLHAQGYRIWYDAGIEPGTNWEDSIAQAIAGAEQVLVCLSPRSVASPHVRDEVSYALNRDRPFLAAYLEETDLPAGLELRIGNKQAILLFRHPDEDAVGVIAQALRPSLQPGDGRG